MLQLSFRARERIGVLFGEFLPYLSLSGWEVQTAAWRYQAVYNILRSLTSLQGNVGLLPLQSATGSLKKKKKKVGEMLFFGYAPLQSTSNCVLNVLVTQEGKYALATFGCENKPDAALGRNLGF